jgi:hypothetical protein
MLNARGATMPAIPPAKFVGLECTRTAYKNTSTFTMINDLMVALAVGNISGRNELWSCICTHMTISKHICVKYVASLLEITTLVSIGRLILMSGLMDVIFVASDLSTLAT